MLQCRVHQGLAVQVFGSRLAPACAGRHEELMLVGVFGIGSLGDEGRVLWIEDDTAVQAMLGGPGHRRLLPRAALLGAVLVLLIDTLARAVTQVVLPPGVLTSLLKETILRMYTLVIIVCKVMGWIDFSVFIK